MSLDDVLHGAGQLGGGRPGPARRPPRMPGPARRRPARRSGRDLDRAAARRLILEHAVALLSGPTGLASWLRTGTLPAPAAAVSLPLDIGAVTDIIPPHLRRAIIARDRHCAAPGCDQPPAACQVHHVIPRSRGGTTSLGKLSTDQYMASGWRECGHGQSGSIRPAFPRFR